MLEYVFGRRDPTRNWQQTPNERLRFALDAAQLNTAGLGDSVEGASFLGPAEDRRDARKGIYCYYSRGVCLSCEKDLTISCFELVFRDEDERFRPYSGEVVFRGSDVPVRGMQMEDFQRQFGECYWRSSDEDETILFYEISNREWQAEFDEEHILKRLLITSDPLMSDAHQRKAYGVTKSWPPKFANGQ